MLAVVRIPALDSSTSKATLLRFTVAVGEQVARGAQLAEIETEKASFPVEAPYAGKVAELLGEVGAEIEVGAKLLLLETDDAAAEKVADEKPAAPASARRLLVKAETPQAYQCSERERVLFNEDIKLPVPTVPRLQRSPSAETIPVTQFVARAVPLAETRKLAGGARRTQERMLWSAQNIPTSSVTLPFEFGPLKSRVAAARAQTRQLLNPTDVLIWAAAQALPQFPELNAYRNGDALCLYKEVHAGIVYDIKGELTVPALRNADKLSIAETAVQLRELYKQVTAHKLPVESLGTATFTISNLSGSGVTLAHPVVNAGQAAILLIGAPYQQPVTQRDTTRFAEFVNLTLGFDHSIVNGVRAGAFLKAVATRAHEARL